MRTKIQVSALLLALCVLGFWCLRGDHRVWTATSVPVKRVDPITQIEVDDYQPRFVPGVDFLVGGMIVAGFLTGSSFLFGRRDRTKA